MDFKIRIVRSLFFFSTKFAFNVKAIYTCKDKHVALNRLHYYNAQQQHLTSILIKEGGGTISVFGENVNFWHHGTIIPGRCIEASLV